MPKGDPNVDNKDEYQHIINVLIGLLLIPGD
jgi:hypothetical protein